MIDRNEAIVASAVAGGGIALGFAAAALADRFFSFPPLIADCTDVEEKSGVVAGVPYLERMRGGAAADDAVPMVVVFHSRGASPKGYTGMLKGIGRARLIIPAGAYENKAGGRLWFELGVKAGRTEDPAGAASQWEQAAARAAQFIRAIMQCRPTVGRPILTGSSQGGEMTLLMASLYPQLVHAGVAVSGYLLEPFWTGKMAPVRMINGTGDRTVPYAWAKEYYETVRAAGAPVAFASYSSSGHSVTKAMSNDWIASVKGLVGQTAGLA